nr:TPA_asm: m17.5 sORF 2 [Murid betaherpesvirus 1]DBA07728.1 TPA_asm: m17.5 sORF 2 [Murid betaherpesvirus 1]
MFLLSPLIDRYFVVAARLARKIGTGVG